MKQKRSRVPTSRSHGVQKRWRGPSQQKRPRGPSELQRSHGGFHVMGEQEAGLRGLADHARSWVQQKWRHKKICPNENEAPVQDPKECTTEKLQEEMSPDIENATSEYHHSPVEVLQDLILEDIEDDEMPPLCGHDSPK
ncbi:uncharacterized protein LOC118155310 isoform X2 [Callithrix jacchus]